MTINDLSTTAGPFQIYINDLHLEDIQIKPIQIGFDDNYIIAAFQDIQLHGQFQYKIQQQVYPYIQVNSTAEVFGQANGYVTSEGYIDYTCPNFIQNNNSYAYLTIQNFQIDLNLDGAIGSIIQGFLDMINNGILSVLEQVCLSFLYQCFDYATYVSTSTTRFSLGQPDDLIWTDLRYLDTTKTNEYLEFSLPGNVCINNGTTLYKNQTVEICKGWHMNNSQLIVYQTNDNLQYMINKYQFQGIFDSLQENNLLNFSINNQSIKKVTIEQFAHTGVVIDILIENNYQYQFLASIQPTHIQSTWKVVILKLELQIEKQLDEKQLSSDQLNKLSEFISKYGVSYQDASYIDYSTFHIIYINDEWALATTQLTKEYQNE